MCGKNMKKSMYCPKLGWYNCSHCKEEWSFCPEDYEMDKKAYPTKCPQCSMPITQMIKDVFETEGLWRTLKMLWVRIKNLWKK
jgi:DNA-directed RNA polymerase subunit RPC12/RpoP